MRHLPVIALLALLAACGGGEEPPAEPARPAQAAPETPKEQTQKKDKEYSPEQLAVLEDLVELLEEAGKKRPDTAKIHAGMAEPVRALLRERDAISAAHPDIDDHEPLGFENTESFLIWLGHMKNKIGRREWKLEDIRLDGDRAELVFGGGVVIGGVILVRGGSGWLYWGDRFIGGGEKDWSKMLAISDATRGRIAALAAEKASR